MLHLAVCDDVAMERKEIRACSAAFFDVRGRDIQIDEYASAEALLASDTRYDLYLLDVSMPQMDGITAAAQLKAADPDAVIVFITSMLGSAVDSYRVEAAGFLLKPLTQDQFNETMERLIRRGLIGPEATLRVIHGHTPLSLPVRRIVLMESDLHRIHIHLGGETLTVSGLLSRFCEELRGYPEFFRCHQSYLVNLNFVEGIRDNRFCLKSGARVLLKEVPISRAYLKACKKAFYEFRLGGMK